MLLSPAVVWLDGNSDRETSEEAEPPRAALVTTKQAPIDTMTKNDVTAVTATVHATTITSSDDVHA